jgi:hypothetical protein
MNGPVDKTLVQFKSMFFDAEKILNAAGKAIVKNLNYIGGYVAKVARHSIKKGSRHQVSTAGAKPLSHTGLLKKHIYYGYNPMHESVIVGPALLNTKSKNAPAALEYGGQSIAYSKKGKRKINVKARPYINPALLSSRRKIADIWKNSIKK